MKNILKKIVFVLCIVAVVLVSGCTTSDPSPDPQPPGVTIGGVEISIFEVELTDNRDKVDYVTFLVTPEEELVSMNFRANACVQKDSINESCSKSAVLRFSDVSTPTKVREHFYNWKPVAPYGDYTLRIELINRNNDSIAGVLTKDVRLTADAPKIQ